MQNENDNPDFEKMFTEIVNSEELKEISENYQNEVKFGTKELLLIQQSLSDVISHVSELMLKNLDGEQFLFTGDNVYHSLLSSLYKISEDFNECMLEYYSEFIDEDFDEEGFDGDGEQ